MSVSRRSFLAAVPAAAAAQVVVDNTTRADLKKPQGPIRIAAMNEFSPEEIKKIESAAPDVKILVSKSPAEFRTNLREADVVYGNLRNADLDYAPKVKWLQAGGAGMEGMEEGSEEEPDCGHEYGPHLRARHHRNRYGAAALPHPRYHHVLRSAIQ